MATSTIPLITSTLVFIIGIFIITGATKRDDPSSVLLALGAAGIIMSFLINAVFK